MTGGADSKTSSAIIEKKRNSAQPEDISLYVHFPFCSRLCGYCDFHKEILNRHREKLYFEALKRETELAAGEYYNSLSQSGNPSALTSLYIGGGTPSLADPRLFADWIGLLKRRFEITERTEFTVELNPESSHLENLELYKEFGVNRLSIGVQSFDTTALAALDR
ncbi:MAG: radical SAM protein, partial [Candidatus Zixiibacteriota bacterium]